MAIEPFAAPAAAPHFDNPGYPAAPGTTRTTPTLSTPTPTPTPTPSSGAAPASTPGSGGGNPQPAGGNGTFSPALPNAVFNPLSPDLAGRNIFVGVTDSVHQSGSRYSVDGGPGTATTTHTQLIDAPTASDFIQRFANWSINDKAKFIDMQNRLFKAGFYGSHGPAKGSFTTLDQQAVMTALSGYVYLVNNNGGNNGITFDQYINGVIKNGGVNGGGGGGPTRAPLQLTDPTQLHDALQQAAQNALGRNLNDKELSSFVGAFHGLERNAYNRAGSGHTVTPPDIGGQATAFVDKGHAGEEAQRNTATYLDVISQLLGVK